MARVIKRMENWEDLEKFTGENIILPAGCIKAKINTEEMRYDGYPVTIACRFPKEVIKHYVLFYKPEDDMFYCGACVTKFEWNYSVTEKEN